MTEDYRLPCGCEWATKFCDEHHGPARIQAATEALHALLSEDGWAEHYRCGWDGDQPPSDGMCGKESAERESVTDMVALVMRIIR